MGQQPRAGSKVCGVCGNRVKSKIEHLKYVHGWIDCAYCHNSMERSSMENHLKQKHNHQKDQKAVPKKETKAKVCRDCKVMVHSMAEHLDNVHGYVRCNVCNNQMAADSLDKHLSRSHGQNSLDNDIRDLKVQHLNDIDKIQSQTHKIDTPKLLSNRPFAEFLQPVATNSPSVNLSNIYDLVADKNGATFINEPQTSSMANVDGTYFNTILISDKELNKLMGEGRIGSQHGQLFLRES